MENPLMGHERIALDFLPVLILFARELSALQANLQAAPVGAAGFVRAMRVNALKALAAAGAARTAVSIESGV
jgi:hypothetical protein